MAGPAFAAPASGAVEGTDVAVEALHPVDAEVSAAHPALASTRAS